MIFVILAIWMMFCCIWFFLVRMKVDNELVITNEYKSVSTDAHININIMLRMSDTKLKDDKDVGIV